MCGYPILDDKRSCVMQIGGAGGIDDDNGSGDIKRRCLGAAMIAGQAEASMLIQRIQLPEDDPLHMPLTEPFVTPDGKHF